MRLSLPEAAPGEEFGPGVEPAEAASGEEAGHAGGGVEDPAEARPCL